MIRPGEAGPSPVAYNGRMQRRRFLASAALGVPLAARAPAAVVDTHIHLFDPTRPQGVPWPEKTNRTLYQPALPARYRKLAEPCGVVGAIEVECSPWLEDNQWVLDVAAKDPFILGMIGNLDPADAAFPRHLDRFRANPRFLGIRYGNLWGRNLAEAVGKPAFLDGLRRLAQAGLVLDTANPNPALLEAVLKLTDRVDGLRVVVDHLPQMEPQPSATVLKELSARSTLWVKISEVLRRVDGRVPTDLSFYRDRLDTLCGAFGEDRVLYGSDWPNSDQWAPYETVFRLVQEFFTGKGAMAAAKYFAENSRAAYRWKDR